MSSTENQQKTLAQQKSDSELKETFGPDFDIETDCPSCGCDRGKHDVSKRNFLIPCESDGEWDDEDMAAFHMERGPPFDEITQEMIQKYRAAEPPAPKKKRKLIIKRRASKKRITPCEPRCQPSPKIGGSWWKDLGYNSACGCAKLANFSAHNPDISITRQGKVFNIRHTAESFDEEFQNPLMMR